MILVHGGRSMRAREASPARHRAPPLIAHVIHRLTIGGMENGLVNLINNMPPDRYRHVIVCLTDFTAFRDRIRVPGVDVFALHKKPGADVAIYLKVRNLLRRLRPDIVHTRNLPAIDMCVPAWLAGVPFRVHGEHGRDTAEEAGDNRKYNRMRRLVSPLVHRYITVSRDIQRWLAHTVDIPSNKIRQVYNGVDAARFRPADGARAALPASGFGDSGDIVFGTVGRMQTVKDQVNLARAFVSLVERYPEARARARLVMVGDGALRRDCLDVLNAAGLGDAVWLPGARDDIADLMRGLDVFVLPSRTEGISNTILEAMASGLPVIATAVGGNPELVVDETGLLVPPVDPPRLADAMARYVADPGLIGRHGAAGRTRVEEQFSLQAMVENYLDVYDSLGHRTGRSAP